MTLSAQPPSVHPATKLHETREIHTWLRRLSVRHAWMLGVLGLGLILLDEFSGITRPFARLTGLLDRGLGQTVVYVIAVLIVCVGTLVLVRARSRVVSIGTTMVVAWGTFAELAYDLFTKRGLTSDYVAISLREIGMAPQAFKTYADSRVFFVLVLSVVVWVVIYRVARQTRLFGPLVPTRVALTALGAVVLLSGAWWVRFGHFALYPLFARPALYVTDYYIQQQFIPERIVPSVNMVDRPTVARHIVFMVDEAVRPDYLSLNGFDQPTTPYLESIGSRFYNLGTAVSGSTCSHASNLMLNSFVRPDHLRDRDSVLSQPTIFHYAKRAGYRTVFLSAVFRSPLFYGIRKADLADIDEAVMINQLYEGDKHFNDHHVVSELAKILDRYADERLFVYVRKQGTHFPFDEYYPASNGPFVPALAGGRPLHAYPARLRNSYMNGIRWNVDSFYHHLDTTLTNPEAVFLFTSDHGEYLEVETEGLLHCGQHPTMAMVPLWFDVRGEETSRRFRDSYGTDFVERNRDHATHMNIFPTLLTMMNIATDELTLFDDLAGQPRDYYVGADRGTYQTLPFDGR